ncbi:MAG: hypothetical protein JWP87_3337 [Labilithrix sp.]|nr:hypothetical protein [Labilithrix sp.]
MGKIDDMRRQREEQFAASEKRQAPPPTAKTAAVGAAPSSTSALADAEQGKCSECGKTKPVSNGLVAQHQKGFGKACAGSRKPPVG